MKYKVPENSNYCAVVVEIKTLVPIENCDNVVHAIIMGNHVVVSKETQIGAIGLYFPLETRLSNEYLKTNNLYRKSELNSDPEEKGYFEENGRIRCVKFRGNKSEGLFMPIESIAEFLEKGDDPVIGDEFDELNGVNICSKYVVKKSKEQGLGNKQKKGRNPKVSKLIDGQFNFHQDTSMMYKNMHKIKPDSLLSITYKLHGCVSHDTIIETLEHGEKTIKEIVDSKLQCHIKSFNIDTKEIVYVQIDEYFHRKDDGEWYEIELDNGIKLRITEENPVWLPKLNCYRRTKDLQNGDILLID